MITSAVDAATPLAKILARTAENCIKKREENTTCVHLRPLWRNAAARLSPNIMNEICQARRW